MAIKLKKVSKIKVKKKIWVPVRAPKEFGSKPLGESYLVSAEKAVGREMEVNLRDLTGEMRDQNAYVKFKITRANNNTLETQPIGFHLAASFMKRLVRKNTSRVDHVFNATTKDGKSVLIKSLMVGRYKSQHSMKTVLRHSLVKLVQEEVGKYDFSTFLQHLIGKKILPGLKRKLHKQFPMREVVLRVVKLQDEVVAEKELKQESTVVAKKELKQEAIVSKKEPTVEEPKVKEA